jgi:cold shock CspA family protein
MAFGRISRLMRDQGYGFILEDAQPYELEFHWTAVAAGPLEQLHVGQRVEFDKRLDQRDEAKVRAMNIRLVKE